jgi:hypothetical protein
MKKSTLALLVVVAALVMGVLDPIATGFKQAGHQAASIVCR